MRFRYVISEVLVGLWRNVTMTVAMIITMAVSLTLLGASVLLYLQVDQMRQVYYDDVEVSVFLKSGTEGGVDAEQKQAIETELNADTGTLVESWHFEDQQEAFDNFKEIFATTPALVENTVPESLPESYRVKLINQEDFSQFESKYAKFIGTGGVERILNQAQLVEKVFAVIGSLQKLALIIAMVQGIAALMLVINTIQIAAYSKRREVAVMKLVGASNWFIQAPFVLEAVFAGVIGAVIAWGTLIVAKIYVFDGALQPLTSVMLPIPWTRVHLMFPLLAGAGAVVSSITGWFALRFYIRV